MRRLMIGLTLVGMAALIPLWVRADDRQIAQEIVQQLQKHKDTGALKGFGIDLQVEEGVVLGQGVADGKWLVRAVAIGLADTAGYFVNGVEETRYLPLIEKRIENYEALFGEVTLLLFCHSNGHRFLTPAHFYEAHFAPAQRTPCVTRVCMVGLRKVSAV